MNIILYISVCLFITMHQNACLFLCKTNANKLVDKKKCGFSWQTYDDFSGYSVADRNQSIAHLLYIDVLFHNNASFNGNFVVGFYEEVFENDLC